MLMPAHARKVVQHDSAPPLFVQTGVEDQLEGIYSPTVQLPSGGYIVINQTEALVAIDVNSGKATRERNIEATALKTNLEAAAEACRQMRLRDLAGLIVIDFIDMEDGKNNRAVEKKMKDCLKIDRARVQTGRISQFGLFEISRQRRRTGVLELSSEPCDHCGGTGRVRSIESAAIQLLRAVEARAADDRVESVHVEAAPEVALYLLNEKRSSIAAIEASCHVSVRIEADEDLKTGEFSIEGRADGEAVPYKPMQPIDLRKLKPLPPPEPGEEEEELEEEISDDAEEAEEDEEEAVADGEEDEDDDDRNKRGKRGRRGGRRRGRRHEAPGLEVVEPADDTASVVGREDGGRRGRRRRRGGRDRERDRNRTPDIAADGGEMLDAIASAPFLVTAQAAALAPEEPAASEQDFENEPQPVVPAAQEAAADDSVNEEPEITRPRELDHEIAASAPEPVREAQAAPEPVRETFASELQSAEAQAAEARRHSIHGAPDEEPKEPSAPRRMGWWSRRKTG